MNKRDELYAIVLDAALTRAKNQEFASPEFKSAMGALTDLESTRLAREKFEEGKGTKPKTPEQARREIAILFGKDFAK